MIGHGLQLGTRGGRAGNNDTVGIEQELTGTNVTFFGEDDIDGFGTAAIGGQIADDGDTRELRCFAQDSQCAIVLETGRGQVVG
jgi:hypothetical protein